MLTSENPALIIKVTNLPTSLPDLENEVKEFFSFCGHITHFTLYVNSAGSFANPAEKVLRLQSCF